MYLFVFYLLPHLQLVNRDNAIRTNNRAVGATDTCIRIGSIGVMIPLAVYLSRQCQRLRGTCDNAHLTPLAPLCVYNHSTSYLSHLFCIILYLNSYISSLYWIVLPEQLQPLFKEGHLSASHLGDAGPESFRPFTPCDVQSYCTYTITQEFMKKFTAGKTGI